MWPNPEPWVLNAVLVVSVALLIFALLGGIIEGAWKAMTNKKIEPEPAKVGGHSADIDANRSKAGRDTNVNVGDQNTQTGGIKIDRVETVNVYSSGDKKVAELKTSEASQVRDAAFIDFNPQQLFSTASVDALTATANVSTVSSATSIQGTTIEFGFFHPFDKTDYKVESIGGAPNVHITDISSGSLTSGSMVICLID